MLKYCRSSSRVGRKAEAGSTMITKIFCGCLLLTFVASASSFLSPSDRLAIPSVASRVANQRNAALLSASPVPVDGVTGLISSYTSFHSLTLDAVDAIGSSSTVLSETEAWVQPTALVLGPLLNFFSAAMVRFSFFVQTILIPSINNLTS